MSNGIERYLAEQDVRVTADMNVYEASQAILEKKASGASVVDADGKLIGVLSELDCLRAMVTSVYNGSDPGGALVGDIMTTEVEVADAGDDIIQVATSMLENKRRRRPVVKDGKLIGQISCRQILRAVTQDLSD
ncbi:MAG: CBS domain-containing protein [Pseudomonadales bacterium]|nr:CBS domain-containing protein [Pseudomonadales bacterium]MBO6566421.1 CBS domain-containing protein [Pseudomonadales bacterium]MBO6594967.1 CBS domain-containing protein [Pseudomonadales bacterium]MBO6821474.1 CBS domain-containing protein [Pseudomonadales bacterium]